MRTVHTKKACRCVVFFLAWILFAGVVLPSKAGASTDVPMELSTHLLAEASTDLPEDGLYEEQDVSDDGLSGTTDDMLTDAFMDASAAVHDEAGLFTDQQIAELERAAQKYGEMAKVHYYVLTKEIYQENAPYDFSDGIEWYTEELSEAFYNSVAKPAEYEDAVIFTIVIERSYYDESGNMTFSDNYTDRYADVSGQGYGKERLDNKRAQAVFDEVKSKLSGSNYAGAAEDVMKISYEYMKYRPGVDPALVFFRLWFQVLLSFVAGAVIVGIMLYHTGGKITVNNLTYLDAANSRILARRDTYLRTSVTKVKKESSSSSSGGGGGHSGGGGSHGGGHF